MPEKETLSRARKDKRQGKSASTQAGEFVREEFHHIREGKHGARSTKQAIAIGLSKARQIHNPDTIAGYEPLGEEIFEQTGGRVDAFVHSVGTGASSRGTITALRRRKPGVRFFAVEPGESAVLSGGAPGPHKIEGVGIGYVPPLWDPALADGVEAVPTGEAKEMTRRLAREEALFAGTSSGANVVAALRVAQRLGAGKAVVTLLCDSGLKYLNTDVYRRG